MNEVSDNIKQPKVDAENTTKTPLPEGMKEPWQPGQSGNPNGRPKGRRNRATIFRALGEAVMKGKKNPFDPNGPDIDAVTGIALSMLQQAQKGNVKAATLFLDSMLGKVADKTELTGPDGGPIEQITQNASDADIIQRYMESQKPKPKGKK